MTPSVDREEHSLEMHLPYIRHVFRWYVPPHRTYADDRQEDLRLVPILVGHASAEQGEKLAQVLEPYFKDPETYFIISSDFCHWYVLPFCFGLGVEEQD